MANALFDYVIKSPLDSLISWTESNGTRHIVSLPIASGGSFNRQVELQRLTTVNCRGLKVTAARPETGEDPQVKLTFGGNSLPLLGLRANRRWETTSTSNTLEYYRSNFDVPADGVVPGLVAGYFGHGILENAPAKASYIDAYGLSTDLAQTSYSNFDPSATPRGFAVGRNGALKFGSELWNKSVSFAVSLPSTAINRLGNLPYTQLSLKVRVALVNLQVFDWIFPSVTINPQGEINFQAADSELNFFVHGDYEINVYGKLAPC